MRHLVLALALLASMLITGCGFGSSGGAKGAQTTVPATPVAQPGTARPAAPNVAVPQLPGDQTGLKLALTEPSAVKYEIVVVQEPVADRTAYLDQLMADRKWPEAEMLVLVIFAGDGHDVRFGMGPIFFQQKVTVDEMLTLVREQYLPKARTGDPAAGLMELVRSINKRIGR